jgi:hypothetical protein
VNADSPERCFLIFVDGFGIPAPSTPGAALYAEACPTLDRLLRTACVPLNADLGIPGMPQSATGQTAIFTGVNAARELNAHQEGFPDARLREIIVRDNLFQRLLDVNRHCLFANAYVRMAIRRIPMPFRSVTTVMTLAALGRTREREELLNGLAVYHDLTRESLPAHGIDGIPVINEATAAAHFLATARLADFCLFEFFLTDHVGHRGGTEECRAVLRRLDRFVTAVIAGLDPAKELLLLISDHGNIESPESRTHTRNPVPWIAVGRGATRALDGMGSLTDATPKILELLTDA